MMNAHARMRLRLVLLAACGGGEGRSANGPASLPRPRIVFLHGMLAGNDRATIDPALEARLESEGFDVATPMGRIGLCDWNEASKAARCWPSDEQKLEAARAIASTWPASDKPTLVVGFSNGGAFATLLALHGLYPACGFASLHGFPAGDLHADGPKRPLLLIAGRAAEWEPDQLAETTAKLQDLGWRFETKLHAGGHAVSDNDLRALLSWARATLRECR
jgi:predicted esterase